MKLNRCALILFTTVTAHLSLVNFFPFCYNHPQNLSNHQVNQALKNS